MPSHSVYTDLFILALHHHYNGAYDFTTVPMYAFAPLTWEELECEVSHRVASEHHKRMLWQSLRDVLGASSKTPPRTTLTPNSMSIAPPPSGAPEGVGMYCFSDADTHNPLANTTLWSRHYFLYCPRQKVLILFVMYDQSDVRQRWGDDGLRGRRRGR
eukprot:PhM_4_TR14880/c0_g1_i2/m.107110